jgi:hypothetical protein
LRAGRVTCAATPRESEPATFPCRVRAVEAASPLDRLLAALGLDAEAARPERERLEALRAAGWTVYRSGYVDGTSRDFLLAVHRVSGRQLRRASVAELVEAAGL